MIKYEIVNDTLDLTEFCKKHTHDEKYNQQNVKIIDVPESYSSENILTDKGVLICKISYDATNGYTYHVYNLFQVVKSEVTLDTIDAGESGIKNIDAKYESSHRFILYKDNANNYYTKPTNVMKFGDEYWFRLDADSFKYNDKEYMPDPDGYYKMFILPNMIYDIGITNKEYLTYKISDDAIELSILSNDANKITYSLNSKSATLKTNLFSNDQYLYMSFYGGANSQAIIMMEVF